MGSSKVTVRRNKAIVLACLYNDGPIESDSGLATRALMDLCATRGLRLMTTSGFNGILKDLPIERDLNGKRCHSIRLIELPLDYVDEVSKILDEPIVETTLAPEVPDLKEMDITIETRINHEERPVSDEDITRLGRSILDQVFEIYLRPSKAEDMTQRLREALDQREAYAKRVKEMEVTIDHLGKSNNTNLVKIRNLESELAQLRSNLAVTLNGHKVAISSEVRKELSRIMQAKPSRHFDVNQDG